MTVFSPSDQKAMYLPSPEIDGWLHFPLPCVPSLAMDIREVIPVSLSCTKISRLSFVSSGTRLLALELKAIYRPFPEIAGSELEALGQFPFRSTETTFVVPTIGLEASGAGIVGKAV